MSARAVMYNDLLSRSRFLVQSGQGVKLTQNTDHRFTGAESTLKSCLYTCKTRLDLKPLCL